MSKQTYSSKYTTLSGKNNGVSDLYIFFCKNYTGLSLAKAIKERPV